jgi:hypothetical protein
MPAKGNGELARAQLPQISAALVEALEAVIKRVTKLETPHFVTLDQAIEISEMSKKFVHAHYIKTGLAIKTGRGWRIPRVCLDEFVHKHLDRVNMSSKMSTELPAGTAPM